MSVREIGQRLDLGDARVRQLARDGAIPGAFKVAGCGRWRFDRERFERALASWAEESAA